MHFPQQLTRQQPPDSLQIPDTVTFLQQATDLVTGSAGQTIPWAPVMPLQNIQARVWTPQTVLVPVPVHAPARILQSFHADRFNCNEQTAAIREALTAAGLEVIHLEVRRGTPRGLREPAIHSCAYIEALGPDLLAGRPEIKIPMLQSAEARVTGRPAAIRLRPSQRARNRPAPVGPRSTIHLRIFAHRNSTALAFASLKWAGLVVLLELAHAGASSMLTDVSESGSAHSVRCHPANFISAFFIQCADETSALEFVRRCDDVQVYFAGEYFLISAEFTHSLRSNYERLSAAAKRNKRQEFKQSREEGLGLLNAVRSGDYEFSFNVDDPMVRFLDKVDDLPDWYKGRLAHIGFPVRASSQMRNFDGDDTT